MRPQSDYASPVVLLLIFAVGLLAGCTSDSEKAEALVEAAWKARVSGDSAAFTELVDADDREHVAGAGVVPNLGAVSKAERTRMLETLVVETNAEPEGEAFVVKADVKWFPPGSPERIEESTEYVVVKTDSGLRLDLELAKRAKIARSLSDARAAIRAGKADEATRLLAGIDPDTLPRSERAMMQAAIDATKASVESAGTLVELRKIMKDHHETEDPAERATLVARARKLGIESLQLPDDIATLWNEAKAGSDAAESVIALGEKMRVEGAAKKVGHGASVEVSVFNGNDKAVAGMRFSVDLIDGDGVRLHRIAHAWEGPLPAQETGSTRVEAPSVPPAWEGAVNVRLDAVSLAD